jgi:hypothetical protein
MDFQDESFTSIADLFRRMGIVFVSYKYQSCTGILDDTVSTGNKFEYFFGSIRYQFYPYRFKGPEFPADPLKRRDIIGREWMGRFKSPAGTASGDDRVPA